MKILSLCLPTNGISEWVLPVLDSIYNQDVNDSLFEVIITDNGNNHEFRNVINKYATEHTNLIYRKTNVYLFYNQLEALKLASGEYLKFINHRSPLVKGSLSRMIEIIQEYSSSKPVIYFSNGVLKNNFYSLNSFNDFVKTLRRFCSWTTGVGIWKEDYKKIPNDIKIDKISPHSCILFSQRNKDLYIIDNIRFCKEIETDHSKKGNYDLFKAFAVEEPLIALNLYVDGDISANTFKYIKKDYERFLSELYYDFVLRKKPCSYDITGFNNSMNIFYRKFNIIFGSYLLLLRNVLFFPIKIIKKKRK